MLNFDDPGCERRSALSTLLRYAEHEALQLNESGLADRIRTAYLSMDGAAVAPDSAIKLACANKMRSSSC